MSCGGGLGDRLQLGGTNGEHDDDRTTGADAFVVGEHADDERTVADRRGTQRGRGRVRARTRLSLQRVVGAEHVAELGHFGGGTDMGDLGHVMPVLHPWTAGATGNTHGADFRFTDYDVALIKPTKALALTVVDLLGNGAANAKDVLDRFQPRFTKDGYLSFVRGLDQHALFDYVSS